MVLIIPRAFRDFGCAPDHLENAMVIALAKLPDGFTRFSLAGGTFYTMVADNQDLGMAEYMRFKNGPDVGYTPIVPRHHDDFGPYDESVPRHNLFVVAMSKKDGVVHLHYGVEGDVARL